MLPTLQESAVILSALARIARRAAYEQSRHRASPSSPSTNTFHDRGRSGEEDTIRILEYAFKTAQPWPTAIHAAQQEGIRIEEWQARTSIQHKEHVPSPDRFEEDLLAAEYFHHQETPQIRPAVVPFAASKPWPSQVVSNKLGDIQNASVARATVPSPSVTLAQEPPSVVHLDPESLLLQESLAAGSTAATRFDQIETDPEVVLKAASGTPGANPDIDLELLATRTAEKASPSPAETHDPNHLLVTAPPAEPTTESSFASAGATTESSFASAGATTESGVSSERVMQPGIAHEASNESKVQDAQPNVAPNEEHDEATAELDCPADAMPLRGPPLTASKVPSSRLGRLFHYGSLGAGLAWGAAGSYLSSLSAEKTLGSTTAPRWMSESNIRLLVSKLSTMRGAALKLGQFMSIQDSHLLPPELESVLMRVQNSAHYMPDWQLEKVMRKELGGKGWKERWFESFEERPFAAASIGQVHAGVLRKDLSAEEIGAASEEEALALRGKRVAVKVQFPGVKESIKADTSYLKWLVSASALLPRGLFLENTLRVMEAELEDECDYEREAEMNRRFRHLIESDADTRERFAVPRVVNALCTSRVLTTEMMAGQPLTQAISHLKQTQKDAIATSILELSLRELFQWRLMQTDPNWTNFLWNGQTRKIELIDFGATREYSERFMDHWVRLLWAAVEGDREECRKWSLAVGYLTGEESEKMLNAHLDSMIALGEPFRSTSPSPYPFTNQTITSRVRDQIPIMLRERLTPPPSETYSLNRKLSGAFLLCAKLGAQVECRDMMKEVTKGYRFGDDVASGTEGQGIDGASARVGGTRSIHTALAPQVRRLHHSAGKRDMIRYGREGHGRNLGARWPRSVVDTLEKNAMSAEEPVDGMTESRSPVLSSAPSIGNVPTAPGTANAAWSAKTMLRKNLPTETASSEAQDPSTVTLNSPAMAAPLASGTADMSAHVYVRGVKVPRKPAPPGPEDCCMSGCARCVYDLYMEDLQDYHEDLTAVRQKLLNAAEPPLTQWEWDEALLGKFPQGHADAAGDGVQDPHRENAESEVDAVISGLDLSMKAFLEMERKIKSKTQAKD
ncbi:ABC1-domain-containing protein [Tilletiaria anomala UBC 951]|uniref:ABC1-domain-containing protein n=1 Tax=Tilletiaria anomala (strain ATCC 24038 / CBS 436.72 / UBC 951) TaxID=1037660 RepID=A0A066WA50_TILAU|nr:ABC1-domain-containing protein [Tilletiaria anomala UBC 951]KDN47944.1 ABC1-domain-containing protein [Tilletiaria anomala UBC 951]